MSLCHKTPISFRYNNLKTSQPILKRISPTRSTAISRYVTVPCLSLISLGYTENWNTDWRRSRCDIRGGGSTVYLSQIPPSPAQHPEVLHSYSIFHYPGSQCSPRVFVCWFYSLSPMDASLFVIFSGGMPIAFMLSAQTDFFAFPKWLRRSLDHKILWGLVALCLRE